MIYKKTQLIHFIIVSIFLISCKKENLNLISYYNKVNEIDSIYRVAQNSDLAIKEYRELFEKYPPKNQDQIEEYETYIQLSEQHNIDFGGKESLYKLMTLIAPSRRKYKKYLSLFEKYGIDDAEVKYKINSYRNSLKQRLIDSLTIASHRDAEGGRHNIEIMRKNDHKNLNLFLKIFDEYGYPSEEKVGSTGNDGEPLIIITILSHLICMDYNKIYPKLNESLERGDISPRKYALIIDKYYLCQTNKGYYNIYGGAVTLKDSMVINYRRKTIGLPSLKYSKMLYK